MEADHLAMKERTGGTMSQLSKGISNAARDHFHVEVGRQLQEIRKSKGMTCRELGAKTGLTLSSITHAEAGQSLSFIAAALIAKALGVTLAELVPPSSLERPWERAG
jgi:DNA-binding XRE family transcriptional regulator